MRMIAYCGDHVALTTTRYGQKVYVDTRDTSLAPHLLMDGDWEPWMTGFFRTLIASRAAANGICRFVDVGANFGWFTLLAHHSSQNVETFSFEANPHIHGLLDRTLRANGIVPPRGRLWCAAVSNGNLDRVSLSVPGDELGGARVTDRTSKVRSWEQLIEVETCTLDDAIRVGVDVIKIDVEGHEPQVVGGASCLIEENSNLVLLIEHNKGNATMVRSLEKLGFIFRHADIKGTRIDLRTLSSADGELDVPPAHMLVAAREHVMLPRV